MSCEIKRLANVADLQHVKEFFGFSGDENWLNAVYHSVSPTAEVLAIGHGAKLVLMSTRWDNELQNHKYTVTWKGDLENPNDIVTSIICLPIVGASSSSAADWSCIAVGLATGIVQFYTDFGLEIYAQQWHNEPVQCIRAQSGRKITEELHIMYGTCVCIVQGTHLFQTLRSTKHHHQRSKASATVDDLSQESVPCRKWSYGGKGIVINDASVVGAKKTCAFEHLLTASMEGGFYAKYKSAPPQNSLIVAIGSKPFVGFHWAKEGFVQPVLADVARAVASKLKSALPTWLTGPQTPAADVPPPPIPAEPMTLRFGLCDIQRTGLSVWVAPGNQLAAVADNLGRVILVDCHRCIAVRVWKGYRDAQCSFIKATEKTSSSSSSKSSSATTTTSDSTDRRHALFLVIFAPRRSCLEIWSLQRGPKVAAFSASKHGQLIYNSHSLMGWNGTSKIKYSTSSCMFFDPSDSSLKEITVPFHCALTDSNSKTAKDLHLLRRLKSALKSGDDDGPTDSSSESTRLEDIATLCRSFQTDDIRLQCIEMLVKNNRVKPHVLKVVLDVFQEHLMEHSTSMDTTAGSLDITEDVTHIVQHNYFTILLANYSRLVEFYMYVTANGKQMKIELEDATADNLSLSEDEVDNLQRLIDLLVLERNDGGIHSPKVTFHENVVSNNFVDYLAAFNCSADDGVRIKDDYGQVAAIGQMIFETFLERGRGMDRWLDMAKSSSILSDDLLRLFLSHWLQKPFLYTKIENLIASLIRFTAILQQICAIDAAKVKYEYGSISTWWQSVREMLLDSASAPMSLLAAMMCRNHAARYRQRENSNDETSSTSADEEPCWEQVSQETAQWSLLIGKLDDIAALGAVLNCAKERDVHEMPLLPHHKPDISLCAIVNGGQGIVSEMIAKWIASLGVEPTILLEDIDGVDLKSEDAWFVNYLNTLRRHFPFSTQSGRLLCHLAWDFMSMWSKNMTDLSYLRAALKYLDTIKAADYALKHGICCMIWNAHLKIPLEATKNLVNKWSRLPKERLCLQDIGIADFLVPEFLDLCRTFLKHFTHSVDSEKLELRFEELLQDGPVPLTLLALQQTAAQSDLLRLHRELTEVLFVIASLGIRYPKPIQSQFDAMSNEAFFTEINRQLTHALPVADVVLQRRRLDFLCTAITSTMDLIREDTDCVYLADHKLWMERIVQIANDWSLDIDQLKKHQIVELYAYGWDDYAEEQLDTVLDTESLGGLLLRIAGRRLNIYTKNSPTAYAQVASIGPLIVDYLDTLHNSNATQIYRTSSDISLDKLIALTGQAFKCLAKKDTKDLRLAGQMFDACAFLKENSITST